jgi:hypothetical protein
MPTCSKCGAEHDVLDPTFRRPEAFVRLDPRSRDEYAKADDDICRIKLPDTETRYFVRGTLAVDVAGHPDGVWWGLWAEVSQSAFSRILELWSDAEQASEPPFQGTLANLVPSYPDTLGIPLSVHLTGPTSRPEFRFAPEADHPFVQECQSGVDLHRASEWNQSILGA